MSLTGCPTFPEDSPIIFSLQVDNRVGVRPGYTDITVPRGDETWSDSQETGAERTRQLHGIWFRIEDDLVVCYSDLGIEKDGLKMFGLTMAETYLIKEGQPVKVCYVQELFNEASTRLQAFDLPRYIGFTDLVVLTDALEEVYCDRGKIDYTDVFRIFSTFGQELDMITIQAHP